MNSRLAAFRSVLTGIGLFVAVQGAAAQTPSAPAAPDAGAPPTPPSAASDAGPAEPSSGTSAPQGTPQEQPLPAVEASGAEAAAEAPQPSAADAAAPAAAPPAAEPQTSVNAADSSEHADYGAVAVTPAPGARIALHKLPSNVQRLDAAALQGQHAFSLHEALNAHLGSVTINDVQSNPLQPDLQYRGFTASPLLGTPQGISVFQNGVRLNEPFGEVVQWDLIPLVALADVQIAPGSNPVYGPNTLGGSLVMHMKDGWSAPGARIEGSAGSFARYRTTAEYGKNVDGWAGYAGASLFGEEGFRDHSRSSAQNLYADLRHRAPGFEVGAGLTLARTDLNGNGPTPVELLSRSRSALYTWPDNTKNDLVLLTVDGQQRVSREVSLQGTLYLRHLARATLNGDASQFARCDAPSGEAVLCSEEGALLRSRTGAFIPSNPAWNAVFNTTQTTSNGFGGSLQLSVKTPLGEHKNQLIVGASYDGAQNSFEQRTELGQLTVQRAVEGGGPSLSGAGMQTDLLAFNHLLGLYVIDTFDITHSLTVHASARLNWFSSALADRLGSALDGHHVFARVNPSVGVTQRVADELSMFAGYGETTRAPSAAELACADPDQPCRLPNAFISDPPLKQVVSRSLELGLRTQLGPVHKPWLTGSLALYGARNQDDILFVAGSRVGTGYFQNAGQTQRLGVELALRGDLGPLSWYASYALLRATFESELRLPRNAAANGGQDDDAAEQEVGKGKRIPGLPLHALKAGLSYRIVPDLEISLSMLGQSSQPLRGDESNQSPFVRGYVVVNAQASYQLLRELSVYVRAQNLLDTKFASFGVLANPGEVLPGATDPRFLGPGAPFGLWVGAVFQNPS